MKNALQIAAAVALLTPLAALGVHSTASAQQDAGCGYRSTDGAWHATNCPQEAPGVTDVAGTIVAINNHFITVQVGPTQQVTMNILPAASRGQTGPLTIGRVVLARGYWDAGEFMAVTIG
jgi:hypothetical protein